VSEVLRTAILEVLGIRVKFLPRIESQQASDPLDETAPPEEPEASAPQVASPEPINESERYGESVVREILGASFLEETVLPAPAPVAASPMPGEGS
jgi:DNA polymerase-3 subunit gamma/tau